MLMTFLVVLFVVVALSAVIFLVDVWFSTKNLLFQIHKK